MAYDWAVNAQKLARAIGSVASGIEADIKAEYVKIGGLLNNEENIMDTQETNIEQEVPTTITESEAQEAVDNAITRDEAIEQGIDVEKVEAEATPVEVVADEEVTQEDAPEADDNTDAVVA